MIILDFQPYLILKRLHKLTYSKTGARVPPKAEILATIENNQRVVNISALGGTLHIRFYIRIYNSSKIIVMK